MSDLVLNTRVAQNTYQAIGKDGTAAYARANRRGEIVIPDPWGQMVQDGRVYIASNAAQETANDCGSTSYVNTQPAFTLDVPDLTTVIPLEISFRQGGTVANATFTGIIELDSAVRITSGVTVGIRNYRFNSTEPNTTKCTAKLHSVAGTNLVVGANSQDEAVWGGQLPANVDELEGGHIIWSVRDKIPPVLVGPASLSVHAYVASTAPSFFWHVIFAELLTTSVT